MRENDKIMTINGKGPRNVDEAVSVIKNAGNQIKLVVLREEDVAPDIQVENEHGDVDASWASDSVDIVSQNGMKLTASRVGEIRSFERFRV